MKKTRVAINGFGRIGRAAFKILLEHKEAEVVAINDLTDIKTLAHLLKYDSVYGRFDKQVESDSQHIIVDKEKFPVFSQPNPQELPWEKYEVEVVLECTGFFITTEKASAHIKAGAGQVIISAPAKDEETLTVVKGVSPIDQKSTTEIISNASCTTNCIAPVAQVIQSNFGVRKAIMTTIHAYTSTQNLVDGPHKDLRRARAGALNIIPTSTGAAKATAKVIPELKGIFDGLAMRVPVVCGSLADFTFLVDKKTTPAEVNAVLEQAAASQRYQGVLEVSREPLVSTDIIGNPASAIVDLDLTMVVAGDLVKVVAWYDNEWGYANRLAEMAINKN